MTEIELPDGTILEFPDGMAEADMLAAVKKYTAQQGAAQPQRGNYIGGDGLAGQAGSGVNEGIASLLGWPVDAVAGAVNGTSQLFGGDPIITDPVGGAGTFRSLLSPLISEEEPAGMGERFARRVGQEVGFGAPLAAGTAALPVMSAARDALLSYFGTSAAGDVGAGIAGQAAAEVTDDPVVQALASIAGGGGSAYAASRMTPALAPGLSLDDVRRQADSAWDAVRADPGTLTDAATDTLKQRVRGVLPSSQMGSEAYPKAFSMADKLDVLQNPRITDVDEARRLIGNAVAAVPGESSIGMTMKDEIASYLAGLEPSDVTGGNPAQAVDDLRRANELSARVHRANQITGKTLRAENRAATSGTGGNEINATRQNIRTLYDNAIDPSVRGRRKGGFTPTEVDMMGDIVHGTSGQNLGRLLGRMAPTSGALPALMTGYGGIAGAGMAGAGAGLQYAVPAVAGGVGIIAKALAERSTKKSVEDLLVAILNGGTLPKSQSRTAAEMAVINSLASPGVPQ